MGIHKHTVEMSYIFRRFYDSFFFSSVNCSKSFKTNFDIYVCFFLGWCVRACTYVCFTFWLCVLLFVEYSMEIHIWIFLFFAENCFTLCVRVRFFSSSSSILLLFIICSLYFLFSLFCYFSCLFWGWWWCYSYFHACSKIHKQLTN